MIFSANVSSGSDSSSGSSGCGTWQLLLSVTFAVLHAKDFNLPESGHHCLELIKGL